MAIKKTSKRLASIAGRVLKRVQKLQEYGYDSHDGLSFSDIEALAASVLSQAEPKAKAKKARKQEQLAKAR